MSLKDATKAVENASRKVKHFQSEVGALAYNKDPAALYHALHDLFAAKKALEDAKRMLAPFLWS